MPENKNFCTCNKKTVRDIDEKKKLINRLSRIEGQIRGIKNMVENDAYCVDILTQSTAVNKAFDSFNQELLNKHIHTCVVRDIKEDKDGVIDELMNIISKLTK